MPTSNERLQILLEAQVSDFIKGFKQAQKTVTDFSTTVATNAKGALSNLKNSFNKLQSSIFSVRGAIISLGAAFSAVKIYDFVKQSEQAFQAQQKADASLRQAMVSMGRYSDVSYKSMLNLAGSLQNLTGYEDDNIETGMKFLMTYRDISDDVMPEVVATMTDLAALMGGDMREAANMLGRASMGMTGSLRRVGITVDDNVYKSQGFIGVLKQIQSQVAGQAAVFRSTQMGGLQAFSNALGDLREEIGRFSSTTKYLLAESLIPVIQSLTGSFQNNSDAINAAAAKTAVGILKAVRSTISGSQMLIEALKPIYEAISTAFGLVVDGFNQLPEFIKDVGIIGVLVLGKRGRLIIAGAMAVIGAADKLLEKIKNDTGITQTPSNIEGYGGTVTDTQNPLLKTPIDLKTGEQIQTNVNKTNESLITQNNIVGMIDQAIINLENNWQGMLDVTSKAENNLRMMNDTTGRLNSNLSQTNNLMDEIASQPQYNPNLKIQTGAQNLNLGGDYWITGLEGEDIKLSNAADKMKFTMDGLGEDIKGTSNEVKNAWVDMANNMTADFSRLFVDVVEGRIKSFGDFALGILGTIAGEFVNMGMSIMLAPAKQAVGNWFSSLFAANGGIFKGGFQTFATGGVVNKPTLGLVGEGHYNEAVIPLPDGKNIPVKMNSNNGTVVQIINNAGVGTDVQKGTTTDGRDLIKIVLNAVGQDILKNGTVGKSIRDTFGLRR